VFDEMSERKNRVKQRERERSEESFGLFEGGIVGLNNRVRY
jgi:hypothetical protein